MNVPSSPLSRPPIGPSPSSIPAMCVISSLSQGGYGESDPLDSLLTAYGHAHQPAPAPKPNPALLQMRAPGRLAGATQGATGAGPPARRTHDRCLHHQNNRPGYANIWKPSSSRWKKNWPDWSPIRRTTRNRSTPWTKCRGWASLPPSPSCATCPSWGNSTGGKPPPWRGWRRGPAKADRGKASAMIRGGRPAACATHSTRNMSAIVLAKHKQTTLGKFYHHLRDHGKPAKVALTAVMRKLIVHMNQILKEHASRQH